MGHATDIKAEFEAVYAKMDTELIHPSDRFCLALEALEKLFPGSRLQEVLLETGTMDWEGEEWEGVPAELEDL